MIRRSSDIEREESGVQVSIGDELAATQKDNVRSSIEATPLSYAERFKPSICIPRANDLIDPVQYEEYPNIVTYWYHWPRDGCLPEQDYEPVVILHNNGRVLCVITRRHWEYQAYDRDQERYDLPLEVIFDGSFHPPYIRRPADDEYEQKKQNLIPRDYQLKKIQSSEIPEKFRTGKGHSSWTMRAAANVITQGAAGQMKDPRDYARSILNSEYR